MISGTGRGREEEARTLNICTYVKIMYIYKLNELMVINTVKRNSSVQQILFRHHVHY